MSVNGETKITVHNPEIMNINGDELELDREGDVIKKNRIGKSALIKATKNLKGKTDEKIREQMMMKQMAAHRE